LILQLSATFAVCLRVRGEIDRRSGWMVDFGDVEERIDTLKHAVDHRYLNDIDGLDNPTTELIAEWVWKRLATNVPGLFEITVQEHPTRGVIYYGPET
jgi:6-pyruvoyltetrahydropterin/6-carboxytetrahydropterin synthase